MSDRLLKESDVMSIAFQLPYVVNSTFFDAVKALPSARPNNRGICGVCAGRKVCSNNNRNLDVLECSIFELDEHYKISRRKDEPQTCDDCIWSVCNYNKAFEDEQTEREDE